MILFFLFFAQFNLSLARDPGSPLRERRPTIDKPSEERVKPTTTPTPVSQKPDLDLQISQFPQNPVQAGQEVRYEVEVKNIGNENASNITVQNNLPQYLDYKSRSAPGFNCQYQSSNSRLDCTGGSVNANQFKTITIVMDIPFTAQSGLSASYSMIADPDNSIEESNENNNTVGGLTSFTGATMVDHVVDGAQAMEFALGKGFISSSTNLNNAISVCQFNIQGNSFSAMLLLPANNPRCRFDFFKGTRLTPPWKIKSAVLDSEYITAESPEPLGPDYTWVKKVAAGTDDPHFAIESQKQISGELVSVTLTGPENGDWEDAFSP